MIVILLFVGLMIGVLTLSPLTAGAQQATQERIISKPDADMIFAFTRSEWEKYARQVTAPEGWTLRLLPHDTGTALARFNRSTGIGASVQPLFNDDRSPPGALVVGSYYPLGIMRITDEVVKKIEQAARLDLGPGYTVSANHAKMPGGKLEAVELFVTRDAGGPRGSAVQPRSSELAQEATCLDFRALEDGQKVTLAYGYLEGIQAALDKEITDVLVPPSDERHPAWWVLPTGLGEKPASALARKLDTQCRSAANAKQTLLNAFLAISHKQDGWPSIGISTDKKKTDPWRSILGGKESSVSCAGYLESRDGTRQAIVHGYYLGTQALKTRLGSGALVWPSSFTPQAVRLEADRRCGKEKTATLRDVMWVITAELSVRNPRSFTCKEPLPEFTLGPSSNPSDAEIAKLCACIWSKLPEGGWEREVSTRIRRGEDPGWRGRGFPPRFGAALDACGGRGL